MLELFIWMNQRNTSSNIKFPYNFSTLNQWKKEQSPRSLQNKNNSIYQD